MCWRMSSVRSGLCWILCLSRSPILARCNFWRCSWNDAGVFNAVCVSIFITRETNANKKKMSLTETYNQRSRRKECFITYAAWFLGPLIACKAVSSSASPSGLQREHRNVKGGLLLKLCCHRGKRFLIKVTLAPRRRQMFDPTRFFSFLPFTICYFISSKNFGGTDGLASILCQANRTILILMKNITISVFKKVRKN